MKKLLLVFLVSVLILPVSNSWSAVKPGLICKKVGLTSISSGIKYTCIKSGKKLVWNKGVRVASTPSKPESSPTPNSSTSPAPTPTPSPTPTPKPLTVSERWDATGSNALNVFRKWGTSKEIDTPKTKIEYQFSTGFWPEVQTEFKKRFDSVVAYFDRYTNIEIPVYFSAGTYKDLDWACKLLETRDSTRRYQACLDDQQRDLNEYYHVSRGYDLKNGSANFYLIKMKEIEQSADFQVRIEHEYFHTVQQNLLRDKFRTNMPCWFLEGGSEFFGMLTFSHGDAQRYLQFRYFKIFGAPERRPYGVTATDLTKWLTDSSVPWMPTLQTYVDQCAPYRLNGMYHDSVLATEWMVSKIGVDGMLNLIKDAGNTSWNASFEKHLGMSVNDGLRAMGEYMYAERKIAEANDWIRRDQCRAREPGPVQDPPGCWF